LDINLKKLEMLMKSLQNLKNSKKIGDEDKPNDKTDKDNESLEDNSILVDGIQTNSSKLDGNHLYGNNQGEENN